MKVLVALGGNAIQRRQGEGTAEEQLSTVRSTCRQLVEIVRAGHKLAITHGNGPQVGDILLAYETAQSVVSRMPLDICGAESQGMIGYMLQQAMGNELRAVGLETKPATVVTQTVVSRSDEAFSKPSKPIGPFYTLEESARLEREKGWNMINDANRGYRRVVPSPAPIDLVERELLLSLFEEGRIVISTGGGGVPVLRESSGEVHGVEAVIDKDLGAALLAKLLKVDMLLILTDVDGAYLNYGKANQKLLDRLSVNEGRKYLREGYFLPGSMGPKVEAAIQFIESGGKGAVITSLDRVVPALEGKAATLLIA